MKMAVGTTAAPSIMPDQNLLPLSGRRIAVTRARDQSSELAGKLTALGAEVVELPLIKVSKSVALQSLADVLLELGSYDWIVFTSANGVRYFFEEFLRVFDDIRSLGLLRFASIGDTTSSAIRDFHLKVECQPPIATADALADAMIGTGSLDSAKIVVITGNLNRDTLVSKLEAAGAIVDQLQVYQTEKTDLTDDPAAADFRLHGADAILFASSSAAQSFADQASALKLSAGAKRPLAGSIGPQTSETMKAADIPIDFKAKQPGLDSLVEALVKKLAAR
jgi:uroporphyrinogen-III synthase